MIRMPSVGEDFGRYHLVRELGHGGMGIVYVAVDKALRREVALKIITPQLAGDEDYRARFKREALALSRMDSPHVVQVHDHGELDGCLFLVTQLIPDGDLLGHVSSHGALPPSLGLGIVTQVLEGLSDAHRAGIVHRDVKPSNILLRHREQHSDAYLCDFGIATTADDHVTRTGLLVGSLPYMAPERHQGGLAEIAGDLYSVGCLLWQVLTGTPPYAGTDVEVALAHIQAPVPQLPEAGEFSAAVNEVLRRALAKLPQQRYPSAKAMRADLLSALEVAPGQITLPEQTQVRHPVLPAVAATAGVERSVRRRAAVVAAAAVAGVLVATSALYLGLRSDPAARGRVLEQPGQTSTVTQNVAPVLPGTTLSSSPRQRAQRADPAGAAGPGVVAAPPEGRATDRARPGQQQTRGPSPAPSQPNPQPTQDPNPDPSPEPSPEPTPEPTPEPEPPTAPTFRCWNGAETMGAAECPPPTGVAGLAWVFSNPRGCTVDPPASGRVTVLLCPRRTPKGNGVVRLVEWSSARAAAAFFAGKYRERPSPWRASWGYSWLDRTSLSNLYAAVPFSASVNAENARARDLIAQSVDYRRPRNLRGEPIR